MAQQALQSNLVLGTAGHIDHGKSALVLALTGIDPDRLVEEKKRGITIELGFARLDLGDGRSMGVVDVPGHEKFVRQMIAGATGIDVALLVIAADDGIMPQTVEHLAILQTLGISSCVVALTKIDLVDADWVAMVTEEIRNFLAATPYKDAPIVPVSSKTGEGVEAVRAALAQISHEAEALHRSALLRQPIDRVFTIKGAGTVVTGTLWSGVAKVGDVVEILPGGLTSRIRSIQMHDQPAEAAEAGNRVALNLADVKVEDIHPGNFLAAPGLIQPTARFDMHFSYIDTAHTGKKFKSGARVHVAHGTKEVLGRVLLANEQETLASGHSCFAQVRLEEPLPVSLGDRVIVRSYSPVHMIGGGQVLLAHPHTRTHLEGEGAVLEALLANKLAEAFELLLALQQAPVSAQDLAYIVGTDAGAAEECLGRSLQAGRIQSLGAAGQVGSQFFTTEEVKQRAFQNMVHTLEAFHSAQPSKVGMPKEELRKACFARMDAMCFDLLLAQAFAQQLLIEQNGLVGLPSSSAAALEAEAQAAKSLHAVLRAHGSEPPMLAQSASEAGLDVALARRAAARLCEEGLACRLSADWFIDAGALEACKERVAAHLNSGGAGSVSALKDALGVSRKYAVPILEVLDAEGVTVRAGDERRLA